MNRIRLVINAFALLTLTLTFASVARADGARSYISAAGSDAKQCTRANPCRSFDGALAKTNAGGEIIALDSGTYAATTVTKSITLAAAPGAEVGITVASGNAVTVDAGTGDTVVLRGLTLTGAGAGVADTRGVDVITGSSSFSQRVFVERCFISNFERGVSVETGSAAQLHVSDTVVRNNHYGMYIRIGGAENNGASVSHSRLERNDVGLLVTGINTITFYDSVASGNGVGLEVRGWVDISNCALTKNGVGVSAQGGRARIASSVVTGNSRGLEIEGGQVASMGNNMIESNDVDISGGANGFSTFAAK